MFKNSLVLIIIIIVIAFTATLFMTLGVPFFWEDCQFVQIREYPDTQTLFLSQLKENLFKINYYSRPMLTPLLELQAGICGTDVFAHRLFRALLCSLLALVYFFILKKFTSNTVAFLGTIFFIFVPESWLQIIYQDVGLYSDLFLALAFLLFLKIYRSDRKILKNITLCFIILLIFLSIGAKHEGRYSLFVFFPFCFIYYRKSIIKDWWFYLALLFISVPVLGILGMGNGSGIFITRVNMNIYTLFIKFFKNFRDPFLTLGKTLWGLLFISLSIHLIIGIKKRNLIFWLRNVNSEGLLFSGFWFISALIFNFLIKGWDFRGVRDFDKSYYMYLWLPFLIFLFTLTYSAYLELKKSKLFLYLALILVSTAFLFNLINLNQILGGWGGYWIGLGNLKNFIEKRDDKSLLLIAPRHFYPETFFYGSHNKIELTPLFKDIDYIKLRYYLGDFNNIYVADSAPLGFSKDDQMQLVGAAQNYSNFIYDRLKLLMGKKPRNIFYIYRFTN